MEKISLYRTISFVTFIFCVLLAVYLFFDFFLSKPNSLVLTYPYLFGLIFFGAIVILFATIYSLLKYSNVIQKEKKEREFFYTSLINSTDACLVLCNSEGEIIEANRIAEDLLDLTQTNSNNIFQIIPSLLTDNIKEIIGNDTSFGNNEKINFGIIDVRTVSGKSLSLIASMSLVPNNGNTLLLFTFQEVTEYCKEHEKIKASETIFRGLVESMTDAVALVDKDSRIVEFNSAFIKMLNIRDENIKGKDFFEIFSLNLDLPDETKNSLKGKTRKVFQTGDLSGISLPFVGKLVFNDVQLLYISHNIFKVSISDSEFLIGAVIKDITQEQKLIEQLRETNANLDRIVQERTEELRQTLLKMEEQNFELTKKIEEMKELELALKRSEEKTRRFLEKLPVAIYRTNLKGEFLFANQELVKLLGFTTLDKLIKTNAYDYYPYREERKKVLETHTQSKEEYIKAEYKLINKKGKHIFVQDFGRCYFDPETNQQIFEGVIIDITDETNYKMQLEESERRYRNLFENTAELILQFNIDGQIEIASPSINEILGYTPEELSELNLRRLLVKTEFFDRVLIYLKEKGKAQNLLMEFASKDGGKKYLNGDFFVSGENTYQAILRDVTEDYESKGFMNALFSIFRTFNQEKDIYTIAENIEKALSYFVPIPNFLFALYDEFQNRLNIVVQNDRYNARLRFLDIKDESHPLVNAFLSQKVAVFDSNALENFHRNKNYQEPANLIALPLGTFENPLGIIGIYSYGRPFLLSKVNLYYLNSLAEQIAIGLERKILADKLEIQVRLFEILIESIPYPIYYRDLTSGKYRYCNESFAQFAERPKSEIIGKKIDEVLDPVTVEILNQKDNEIMQKDAMQSFELRKVDSSGMEKIYISIRAPIKLIDLKESAVVGILIDITERVNFEHELQNALNLNKTLLENAPVGIFTTDKNGYITFWNKKAETITGFSSDEVIGKEPFFAFAKLTGNVIPDYVFSTEDKFSRKDGKEITVLSNIAPLQDEKGNILGAIVSFDDISLQKETEKRLKYLADVNTRLTNLANSVTNLTEKPILFDVVFPVALQIASSDYLIYLDLVENNGIPTIVGIQNISFEGRNEISVNIPLDKFVNTYFGKVFAEREPLIIQNAKAERLISQLEFLSNQNLAIFPLSSIEKIVGLIIISAKDKVFEDEVVSALQRLVLIISANLERIAYHNELMTTLDKQVQINELRSNFISMISHEYRTPLQAILLSAQVLQKHFEQLSSEQREMQFRRISRAIQDMASMLDSVLLFNRLNRASERLDFEVVKVKPYFEGLIRDYELYYHDKARIISRTKFSVKEAKVEPRLLQHIFSNLISNAVKYSKVEPTVETEVKVDKNSITIIVSDNGIGIPKEELPLIFEPFYRGKESKFISGTGLGLSIVKNSVDLLGGSIDVDSEPGKGTKFTVTLPLI